MRRISLRILVCILVTSFVLPSFLIPKQANAQTKSVVNITSCTTGGVLAAGLSSYINEHLTGLATKLPGFLAGILGFSVGGIGGTVPVNDANMQNKWTNKESRMDIIARCTAREIYDKMVGNTMNIIRNHGRDGGPLFVRNWRNFSTSSQYRGENVFRAMLSNTQLCGYFDQNLKNTFGAEDKTPLPGQNTRLNNLDPYQLRANCTMPSGWTLEEYQRDFAANGGWAAFAKLLEPQNNPIGSFLMALDEAANQREFEQQLDLAEAGGGGNGFTSRRGRGAADSCLVRASNNQCIVYKDILTPGSTLANSVDSTIQQEMAWITNVDELGEVISTLVSNLMNRMLDLSNNDDSRPVDPADLPVYTAVPPNYTPPLLEGTPGPIEYPDTGGGTGSGTGGGATISGYVFEDSNEDGNLDSGEPLLSNMTVLLRTPDASSTITSTVTGSNGSYSFTGLVEGQSYRVVHNPDPPYDNTSDDSTVVTATTTVNFGVR